MVQSTKVNTNLIKRVGPDHFTIPMDQFIMVNGYTIKDMGKEVIFIEIRINMKEIGRTI